MGLILPEQVKRDRGQNKSTDNIHEMVLPGEQSRKSNETKPYIAAHPHDSSGVPGVEVCEDRSQGDMQRGKQIRRLVEPMQKFKQKSSPAGGFRDRCPQSQRHCQKKDARDDYRKSDSSGKYPQFALALANEWSCNEE
jgi:hypothetical protein